MLEAIKVVQVEKAGDSNILVFFSNGRKANYSAKLLLSLNEVTQRPVTFRDRFWTQEAE